MRLEVKDGVRHTTLINDFYNSDINSLDIALDFLHRRQSGQHTHSTLILSDIEQTGIAPAELYQQVSKMVTARGVDRLIGVGKALMAQQTAFAGIATECYPTTEQDYRWKQESPASAFRGGQNL